MVLHDHTATAAAAAPRPKYLSQMFLCQRLARIRVIACGCRPSGRRCRRAPMTGRHRPRAATWSCRQPRHERRGSLPTREDRARSMSPKPSSSHRRSSVRPRTAQPPKPRPSEPSSRLRPLLAMSQPYPSSDMVSSSVRQRRPISRGGGRRMHDHRFRSLTVLLHRYSSSAARQAERRGPAVSGLHQAISSTTISSCLACPAAINRSSSFPAEVSAERTVDGACPIAVMTAPARAGAAARRLHRHAEDPVAPWHRAEEHLQGPPRRSGGLLAAPGAFALQRLADRITAYARDGLGSGSRHFGCSASRG